MVIIRRTLVIAIVTLLALPLAACGSGWQLAFGVEESDLPGLWVAELPDAPDARIQMNADGTFSAMGWPENLVCSTPRPEKVEGLRGQERVDFAGRWEFGSLSSQPQVYFRGHGECRSGWVLAVLRVSGRGLALRAVLDIWGEERETVRFYKVEPDS
jgi:hypothetical protein